ncbi:MAG: RND family transporter [Myxococcota bacterium]
MRALARFSLHHPAISVGCLLVISVGAIAGLPRLSTDVGYRAFLGAEHPSIRRFDAFIERFGGGLPMIAVWSCDESPCESVFDPVALAMADAVTRALQSNPFVRSAISPASAPLLVPTPRGPRARRLFTDGAPASDRDALARRARANDEWLGRLISPDGRVGAITLGVSSSKSDAATSVYAALDAALAPFEARGWVFHRAGGPVEFVVAGDALAKATARMVPVMVVLVGCTLLVLFRSLPAAAATLVSVGIGVLWTMGLHGWLAWPQNSISQTLPPLILVIGVCDGIHVVARYANDAVAGCATTRFQRRELLEAIAGDVGGACTMTSLTTAAGFVSFVTSPLESFARFGLVAAFGVMATLVLTFSLLPLLLIRIAPEALRTRSVSARWDAALARLMDFAIRRSGPIIAGAVLVGGVCALGMAGLRVDASFEDLYGEKSRVVQWSNFIAGHLARPDRLEIELRMPDDTSLGAPSTLAVVRDVAGSLGDMEAFGRVRSLLDPLESTRVALGMPPPGSPEASAQESAALVDFVSDPPGGSGEDGLAGWVDGPHRTLRLSVEADKSRQDVMRRVLAQVDARVSRELPAGWTFRTTGPYAVVHDMVDAIRDTQISSFATAGVAVLILLSLFLRSPRWAILALVPTVLPVVATLGVMGFFGIPLDVGSAMVAAVVLGIAVDDAIHMLDRLRRLRRSGLPHARAVHDAVLHVGRALATTSFALAIGFAALALSPWQSVANFGVLSAVAILGALLADLLVLPALLLRFGPRLSPA